jgi:hypothetical protein
MDNQDEHVYCINCKYGRDLLAAILVGADNPEECESCYPYDFEDSRSRSLKVNYVEKKENNETFYI